MSWIPGTGELSNRIARALGVKGRIATELDEQIIGQVMLSDAPNEPPYRTDGRWAFEELVASAGVGFVAQISVFNASPVDQVVDRVWVTLNTFQVLRVQIVQGPTAAFGSDQALVTTEGVPPGLNFIETPLRLRSFTTVAIPAGRAVWENNMGGASAEFREIVLGIVLRPNAELVFSGTVITTGTIRLAVRAKFFTFGAP